MFADPRVPVLTLLIVTIASSAPGQTPAPPAAKAAAPGLIKLTGDDEKRAKQLDEQIEKAVKADRWDEAIARAEEVLALRMRNQGPKHFEKVDAEWNLKTLRRVGSMPKDDRSAYRSAKALNGQARSLSAQGKYAQAQTLHEQALEILRSELTDQHPDTARTYDDLASDLNAQGKYAQARPMFVKALEINLRFFADEHPNTAVSYSGMAANLNAMGKYAEAQPLYEKALEINRRLLGDDHVNTGGSYNNLAYNLNAQGKYAQAQPLFEKALGIARRLLTDESVITATSYNNLAANLSSQGKYAQAQPLYEKALDISRRLLTDDHPETATSYGNLAHNLGAQGRYAEAQPLYEKALEIRRRVLSDEHPRTAMSYNTVASNLNSQGKYAQAQLLYEKALEIRGRLLTDAHPDTAASYNNVAFNLDCQGSYARAEPLYQKALEIRRSLLGDAHPDTADAYNNLAGNLEGQGKHAEAQPLLQEALSIRRRSLTNLHPRIGQSYVNLAANSIARGKHADAQRLLEKALGIFRSTLPDDHPNTYRTYNHLALDLWAQGKYGEAKDRWLSVATSLDAARLRIAFTGLERSSGKDSARLTLSAVLARLGQPAEAYRRLEEDLGRGLLDELAARQDRRLAPAERARLRELTNELETLDKVVESTPAQLDLAQRAKRFEDLKRQRELASIALGEFQTKLAQKYGALAGQVATQTEIQAALLAEAALVAWVDIRPLGPNAADPNGEHWGVIVRSRAHRRGSRSSEPDRGGSGRKTTMGSRANSEGELRARPAAGSVGPRAVIEKLRGQRLRPLARVLGATPEGLPPVRRLIVLTSRAMAGIPVEALLDGADTPTVSYAPSGTVFKYLREQPRRDRHAGLLALGDPVYDRPDTSSEPKPLPDHGLLLSVVMPGSNAATHGLKPGDVLLAYNGTALHKREDLKAVPEPGQPVPVEVWRAGQVAKRELAPGKLGVVIDSRPAPVAIAEQRKLQQLLQAARSGGDGDFVPLPGTRYEVEALAQLFKSDDRASMALFGADASETELDRLAASGDLEKFGFIHLATHGVIDEAIPQRSAVILTQTGLPDPLEQVMNHKTVFDGRLTVREIQRSWELKAELVTLSSCETALGRDAGGEGLVGFTQALLMSGARSVCLSLWKVDDTATALLMQRFYANVLGRRTGLSQPLPKAEALAEAKSWLRGLSRDEVTKLAASLSGGEARSKGAEKRKEAAQGLNVTAGPGDEHPYAHPYYWAAFVLVGDPD